MQEDCIEDDDSISEDNFMATVNEDGIMIVGGEGRTIQVDENG